MKDKKDKGEKKRKSPISITLFYLIIIVAEVLIIIAASSGIMELIHGLSEATRNVPNVVWLVAIGALLCGATTVFLARLLTSPITMLKTAMGKVAKGDFEVRLDTNKGFTELRDISASFNAMTEELAATEILQTDFVSNVSHEFKTPINAIEGYATLLGGADLSSSPEIAEYVEKILFNTKRLSALVGNILLLSKVDKQGIPEKKAIYRLDEQIRQALLSLEASWTERETDFDVELDSIEYFGNEPLMNHVFTNLIGNAIKFGPRGGTVRLRLYKRGGETVFTVEDSGEGIPDEAVKHIFNKFYQADSSHKSEGNGLGLALVKEIVTAHSGSVSVENIKSDSGAAVGCRFTVVL